jgi:O-acetylserine/cysteine efflux transporter
MGWYDGAYFMPLKDVLQALAIVLIWGVNFVVIKYGVADVPPLLLGALRFHAGGLSGGAAGAPAQSALGLGGGVWPLCWRGAVCLPVFRHQAGHASRACLGGIAVAGLFTLILAGLMLHERWQAAQILGLLCACAGLALIGLAKGGSMTAIGFGLTLAAAFCWASSNIIVRLMGKAGHKVEPLNLVVWSSLVPPLPYLALSWWLEGPAAHGNRPASFLAGLFPGGGVSRLHGHLAGLWHVEPSAQSPSGQ